MYDDFCLPGMKEVARHFEFSIYHLDGEGALRHLDSILEIPGLRAIQWALAFQGDTCLTIVYH